MHGEDSILSLLALAAAAALLGRRDRAPGAYVGLTMYKPQIALPICGLMLLWRRRRFVEGFALTAAACIALSVAAVGRHAFIDYLKVLPRMASSGATAAKYHIYPTGIIAKGRNLRSCDQLVLAVAACCLVILLLPLAASWRWPRNAPLAWSWLALIIAPVALARAPSFIAIPLLVFFIFLASALAAEARERRFRIA